jgi:hypothetical protein
MDRKPLFLTHHVAGGEFLVEHAEAASARRGACVIGLCERGKLSPPPLIALREQETVGKAYILMSYTKT